VEKVAQQEPQSAADYDERTTAAVKAVLVEMGQVLGSFKGKFAVIGGVVPWLLLQNEDMKHVGTLDVDIGLDAESLGDGEYKALVEALMSHGYSQRKELKKFQLVRRVDAKDGGPPMDVIVDFLMPRDAKIEKNKSVLVDNFAVQRADGADLALRFYQMVAIEISTAAASCPWNLLTVPTRAPLRSVRRSRGSRQGHRRREWQLRCRGHRPTAAATGFHGLRTTAALPLDWLQSVCSTSTNRMPAGASTAAASAPSILHGRAHEPLLGSVDLKVARGDLRLFFAPQSVIYLPCAPLKTSSLEPDCAASIPRGLPRSCKSRVSARTR
jgi:hypothetical protein